MVPNSLDAKMVAGQRLASRIMKWPAVAVVAAASSFYTFNYTRNWWFDLTDCLGLTVNALDFSTTSDSREPPWWRKLLGQRPKEEEPVLPVEVMNEILSKDQFSKDFKKGIVTRFETNQFAANQPIEDRHIECHFPTNDSYMFGIFDGHSGFHCSETIRKRLPQYLSCALAKANNNVLDHNTAKSYEIIGKEHDDNPIITLPEDFSKKQERLGSGPDVFCKFLNNSKQDYSHDELLKLSFLSLDRDICMEAIPDDGGDESLLIGLAGSCAISSIIEKDHLYVASTGDCRAVVGKHSSSGKWIASQITQDQTVDNVSEVHRIESEHPGEKRTLIQRGRLLGQLQPLRSFGDVQYKWSRELHEKVINVVYGRPIVPLFSYLTPPYLTAEPVVSHRELTTEDRFVIIASDGLWERVSSDHAVKLIGSHLDKVSSESGEIKAENGATLLIKYALGKGRNAALANLLTLPQEYKRHFHDDITVTVIYLDSNCVPSKL